MAHRTKVAASIVVCTHNRARLLGQTLLSLKEVEGIGRAEVIVVDNDSKDDTADVVSRCIGELGPAFDIRYLFEPRQGLSIARNSGIAESRGPVVAFLDDDAVPAKNWLLELLEAFERHPEAVALGGIIEPSFESARPDWLVPALELPFTIIDMGERERAYPRKLYPFGANMAVRRTAFEGGLRFPEALGRKGQSLLSGEESWLFGQIRKKGGELYYIPGMKVTHFIPSDRLRKEWIMRRYYYQGVSKVVGNRGARFTLRMLAYLALTRSYVAWKSVFASAPGDRLLNECRRESIRGSMNALRSRSTAAAHE